MDFFTHTLYLKGCTPYQDFFYYLRVPCPTLPPPYQPHPSSSSVLKGLLAADEAVLEAQRAGLDPLVSPSLKGSDYMEN